MTRSFRRIISIARDPDGCVFFFFFLIADGDYTTRVLNPAAVDATADDGFQRVTKIVFKSGPR